MKFGYFWYRRPLGFSLSQIVKKREKELCPKCNSFHVVLCNDLDDKTKSYSLCKDCNHKWYWNKIKNKTKTKCFFNTYDYNGEDIDEQMFEEEPTSYY